jgi:hypothetical protein
LLNWEIITSSISWGTWSFSPENGENLTPENGPCMVQVSVIVPYEKNTEFTGYLRVENKDNPNDFDVVSVYLQTMKNTDLPFPSFFLKIFFERFPHAFPLLRYLLS